MQDAPYLKLPLRNRAGEIVDYALIDHDDAALARYRWHRTPRGYAARSTFKDGVRGTALLHREVLGLVPGDGLQADHINRAAKLDNRRANLRIATNALNHQNMGSQRGSTSTHRGVSWFKPVGVWQAQVTVDGRHNHLGYFHREADAAAAASAFRARHMPFSPDATAAAGTMTA
jgi:hypothetical protein